MGTMVYLFEPEALTVGHDPEKIAAAVKSYAKQTPDSYDVSAQRCLSDIALPEIWFQMVESSGSEQAERVSYTQLGPFGLGVIHHSPSSAARGKVIPDFRDLRGEPRPRQCTLLDDAGALAALGNQLGKKQDVVGLALGPDLEIAFRLRDEPSSEPKSAPSYVFSTSLEEFKSKYEPALTTLRQTTPEWQVMSIRYANGDEGGRYTFRRKDLSKFYLYWTVKDGLPVQLRVTTD